MDTIAITGAASRQEYIAGLLVLVAAFSVFSGVLAWLVLPGLLLLRRHWAWPIAALASIAFVTFYMTGISSDAQIALEIVQSLDPAGSTDYSREVQAAIAANTPLAVLTKTLDLISWPLSSSKLLLSRLLAILSLLLLFSAGIVAFRRWRRGQDELARWTMWCAICALYCLGIIVTVGLGRILDYQDLLHGPSPERHQTFVTMYWLFITGTACSWLKLLTQRMQLAGVLSISAVVLVLIFLAPRDILKNEFISTEFTGYLFMAGEHRELQAPHQEMGLHLTPHYPLAFDKLFQEHQIAYHTPLTFPDEVAGNSCYEQLIFEIGKTNKLLRTAVRVNPPFREIQLNWQDSRSMLAREIVLTQNGSVVGRMVPSHRGDYSWPHMLSAGHNSWRGGLMGVAQLQGAQLWLRSPLGWHLLCRF